MSSKLPTNPFPEFMMGTGNTVYQAQGPLRPVSQEQALRIAQQEKSAVVGLIPFDPNQPAALYVPEAFEKIEQPTLQPSPPAPLRAVHGQDNPNYRAAVAQAVARMNNGEFNKVVLARLLTLEFSRPLEPAEIYQTLRAEQPKAFVFSARLPQTTDQPGSPSYLMGASPELVFASTATGEFTTFPLAGTAARTANPATLEDAQIGEELMRSPKDRAEHATVVQDIISRLKNLTENLTAPATPSLVSTPQVWHLGTRITGQLKENLTSLDGARAIHPTPAICGYPRNKALEVISELENFDRRYFGGLIGWMTPDGAGEWALVLRCAEINQNTATLFAGAGIVKDSQPLKEHEETATKLSTFARALGISQLPKN